MEVEVGGLVVAGDPAGVVLVGDELDRDGIGLSGGAVFNRGRYI